MERYYIVCYNSRVFNHANGVRDGLQFLTGRKYLRYYKIHSVEDKSCSQQTLKTNVGRPG